MPRLFSIYFLIQVLFTFGCVQKSKPLPSESKSEPNDEFYGDRLPYPSEENLKRQTKIIQQIKSNIQTRSPQDFFDKKWVLEGPTNIGGRVSAIAIDPNDSKIIYAGFSNGGVFKTIDEGKNWLPLFDNEITLSIGAITIDPNNSQIIYVGTGDPDINGNSYIGNGLFKSTDAGKSWKNIGLLDVRVINEIIIDPTNSKIIYVGAMGNPFEPSPQRGVFKSTDAGISWSRVLFVSDSAGITDIAMHPTNPKILYACSFHRIRTAGSSIVQGNDSKIFKSTDGGSSWQEKMKGINNSPYCRIAIDISKSDPNKMFARTVKLIDACHINSLEYNVEGIYVSTNNADQWTKVISADSSIICDALGGFGWYFGQIVIDPLESDHLFLLGVRLLESFDAGIHWQIFEDVNAGVYMHSDKHILLFNKEHNFIIGSDGGLYKFDQNTQTVFDIDKIPVTQFYRINLNPNEPGTYYAGAQDNGTLYGNASRINSWDRAFGGDGFSSGFHKDYPEYAWHEYQYGNLNIVNKTTGNVDYFGNGINGPLNWDTPFFLSEHNQDNMYLGSNKIYVNREPLKADWQEISPDLTANGKFPTTITPTVYCIAESPIQEFKLIAGTTNGNIWIGSSQTKTWNNVVKNLPSGYVSNVEASTIDANTFFVSFSNFRSNDYTAYLYKTINNGLNWTSIASTDLAQIPVLDFLIIPNTNDKVIVAGTLYGAYATIDGGTNWRRMGTNMPIIPVNHLAYESKNKKIIAATFARSVQSYTFDQFTFTSDGANEKITYFPNPCSNDLYLKIPEDLVSAKVEYEIINIQGQCIHKSNLTLNKNTSISMAEYTNGFYYLKFNSRNKNWMIKVLKM